MDSIRVIIAHADEAARLNEARLIALAEGFDLGGEAADGEALLRGFAEHRPPVVILDAALPGTPAAECARRIREEAPDTVLIFTAADESAMADAFEVHAFDYLTEPLDTRRVLDTLRRVRKRFLERERRETAAQRRSQVLTDGRLMIRHRDGVAFVPLDEILLVQREDRQTEVICEGGRSYIINEALGEMEARLDPVHFFRCHRGYIVNLNRITAVEPYGRWTQVIKLSGTKATALITKEKLDELMGGA